MAEYPSGKLPTTLVRRRISFMILSRPLLVLMDIIEIYRDRMYILNKLENYEVCVETVIERNKHSMTR